MLALIFVQKDLFAILMIERYIRLPFSIIYCFDDPNDKLDIFNSLIIECIENHAPLKRMKITRPPSPWLHHDEIRSLQTERNKLRHKAHEIKIMKLWETFRKVRCLLKEKIKAAKQHFINKALSSSKPKEVWRVIHRILQPPLQPLRLDVNSLNRYFANTAQRTLGSTNTDPK